VEREIQAVYASNEVILAAGAYNTPQLLMLSGIGPEHHLKEMKIENVKSLPGVGSNLQDRYEIPVIDQVDNEFSLLEGLSHAYPVDTQEHQIW